MLHLRSPHNHSFENFLSDLYVPSYLTNPFNSFKFSDEEIVNDDSKFSIKIDVSQFKPENLQIELNEKQLKVEGEQEIKTERHGYSKKSFSRMVILPEDVDLNSIKSTISNDGKLLIEAFKMSNSLSSSRSIPINFVKQH